MTEIRFDAAKILEDAGTWICLRVLPEQRVKARGFVAALKTRALGFVAALKEYREGRSKDANAYMWCLLGKIAEATGQNKDDVYLQMIERYGVYTHVIVKPEARDRLAKEWRAVRELGEVTINGKTGVQFQCYYGSSQYDTKEMSVLIDGVVSECKDLDIETATPEELARYKEEWCAA